MARSRFNGSLIRARIRHALFTRGADRLLGGRLLARHLETEIFLREHQITIPSWRPALDGIRIGHLTDVHLGDLMPAERAEQLAERLHDRDLDLVAFTGDAVDLEHRESGMDRFFRALASIPAPLGSFLVLGNHDHLDDPGAVVQAAREAGVTVLLDEAVAVPTGEDDSLRIGGIDWAKRISECSERVARIAGPGEPHCDLLLSHNPKAFIEAARSGIPLTLAGHTHGGQFAVKGRPGRNMAVAHRLSTGFYERNDSILYVSTGAGAWFPLRIHCPAELVVLEVRSGPWSDPGSRPGP